MELQEQKAFYTVPESAAYLRIGKSTLYKLLDERKIASVRFGNCRRIAVEALDEYVARCTATAVAD